MRKESSRSQTALWEGVQRSSLVHSLTVPGGCSVSDCKKGQMGEGRTDEQNRSRSQEADSDVCAVLLGRALREAGRDQAEETLNSGAVLTWSQPGKLESQGALQMSQIKARGTGLCTHSH